MVALNPNAQISASSRSLRSAYPGTGAGQGRASVGDPTSGSRSSSFPQGVGLEQTRIFHPGPSAGSNPGI